VVRSGCRQAGGGLDSGCRSGAVPKHARALGAALLGRAARLDRAMAEAHPKEPHWYLKANGVDPAWQGRDLAGRLLRSRLT
jgi:hypothetical protein